MLSHTLENDGFANLATPSQPSWCFSLCLLARRSFLLPEHLHRFWGVQTFVAVLPSPTL